LAALGAAAHAIANATGAWIKDLPITPEKILKALRERSTRGASNQRTHRPFLGPASEAESAGSQGSSAAQGTTHD